MVCGTVHVSFYLTILTTLRRLSASCQSEKVILIIQVTFTNTRHRAELLRRFPSDRLQYFLAIHTNRYFTVGKMRSQREFKRV
jgi:hypothetical protein